MNKHFRLILVWGAAAATLYFPSAVRAQTVAATVTAGSQPGAIAENPATNRTYVVNSNSGTVTVINGATRATATVTTGATPLAVAVNPVTNKIYVANYGGASVTVIDGATNATSTIPLAGTSPRAIAVNSVTNVIYVGTLGPGGSGTGSTVAVINGATGSVVATVSDVNGPVALAVNPVTNKTYVANQGFLSGQTTGAVTVIDGSTSAYAATAILLPTTDLLDAIAVNPVTNQIYTAGEPVLQFGHISQIDGATATVTHQQAVGSGPYALAVNPVTNTVYLADGGGELIFVNPTNQQTYDVWVFGGANVASGGQQVNVGNTTAQDVSTGTIIPYTMVVNPVTNQVYVGNYGTTGIMTVINGANNTTVTLATGGSSSETGITVDPVTNQIYVANYGGSVTVIDGTVTATAANPATGNFPMAMALNPVTNKIYAVNFIANDGSAGTVTVLDGQTHAVTATVPVGQAAWALDVNPVTNKIYVACSGNDFSPGYVYVIDGSDDVVTTSVAVGVDPNAVVVNPVTNRIFVTNYGEGSVPGSISVIDGSTDTVSNTVAMRPYAIAVNPRTNRVYYSNYHSVTVADGTTGATLATIVTRSAGNIAVNPVSNKIYAVNNADQDDINGDGVNTVTVIDGPSNAVLAVLGTALDPFAIAINPATNMVYIADQGDPPNGYVTVVNGATNALAPINLGGFFDGDLLVPSNPLGIAVNPVTNKIYVSSFGTGGLGTSSAANGSTVTVIDANNNNSATNVTVGIGPTTVLVNPVTDETYVLSQGASLTSGGNVTVLGDHQSNPLTVGIVPLAGNQTASATPAFTFDAQSTFSPATPPPQNVYFQVDSLTGPWTLTTPSGGPLQTFSGTVASLAPGLHTLYAYAEDGQSATSTKLDSPMIGAVSVYEFVVTSAATQLSVVAPATATAGTAFKVNVVALDAFRNPAIGYAGTVALTSSDSTAQFSPASGALSSVGGVFSTTLDGPLGVFITNGETVTATDTGNAAITGTTPLPGIEVIKNVAQVTVNLPTATYDGTPHGVTVTTNPFGLAVNIAYTDLSTGAPPTSTPPTAAGEYEIQVSVDNPVYYFTPTLNVYSIVQATPPTNWATPAAVANGTALSSTQLDATSTIPGSFTYNPVAGTVLPFGSQSLSATFIPTDAVDYATINIYTSLTVNPPPPVAPAITATPPSQIVAPGGPVDFSVTATGYPAPTYQWNFNNAPIAGATGSTLNLPVAQAGAAGDYSVTVTNSQGAVTSTVAALGIVTGQLSGDPSLSQPDYLATDGVNLLVGGLNANTSDPNSNAASHQSIFSLALPLGSAPAVSLYPAFNPQELVVMAGVIFWIDPTSGPQSGTQILSAPLAAGVGVNPIYTATSASQPILAGSGLATDGTLLYAAAEYDGSIWSMNPDGSGITQIEAARYAGDSSGQRLNTIAVKQGTIYIADNGGAAGPPAILSVGTDGTSFTTIASGAPLVSPTGIAVGGGMIYVADPNAGNTVWQIPVGGGTPVALFSGSVGSSPIARLGGLLYAKGKLYVTDSAGGAIYEVQVAAQATPRISSPLTANAVIRTNFTYQVLAGGGLSPYTFAATGLPDGLVIDPVLGQISGYPSQTGTFPVTLTVTDSTNPTPQTVMATLQLTVSALTITSNLNVSDVVGNYLYYQVEVMGGSDLYTYSAVGLPPGLTLDPAAGVIQGAITAAGTFDVTLTVTDNLDPTVSGQATLVFSNTALQLQDTSPIGIVNQPLSIPVAAYGGTPPYLYSAQGLPAGLSLNLTSGLITGAPTQTGIANVTLTATDSSVPANSVQQQFAITINSFGIPSPQSLTGTVGTAFSFLPGTVGGTPPYSYSVSTLPPGLTLDPVTGAITGTPTQSVSYGVFYYIQDSSVGTLSAYAQMTITINAAVIATVAPAITSNLSEGATFGAPFSYTITASSSPTSFNTLGLPAGLSIDPVTGIISGTPLAAGTFDVTLGASNAVGTGVAVLVITVAPGFSVPVISSSSQASGQVGAAFSYTILANNTPTAFSASGLPTGLAVSATTGVISGTPTAPGTFNVTLTASNSTAGTGPGFPLTIVVSSVMNTPAITSAATATGTTGPGFSYAITTSVAATSYAATGLPTGLTINATTGVISGTPTTPGTFNVIIKASNATGTGVPLSLTIIIQPGAQAPSITSSLTAAGTQGLAFSYAITGTNTPTSFTAAGLPSGLTLNATTGVISGTPDDVGTTAVVLTAGNATGVGASVTLSVVINPSAAAPSITSGNTAAATIGTPFSYQVTATSNPTSGAMAGSPGWLGINTSTGLLSGTPSGAPGIYTVVLTAANASGTSAPLALAITVDAAAGTPVVTSTVLPAAGTAGLAYADTSVGCLYQIQVLPSTQIQYYFVNGSLPVGLSLDPTHGFVFGTPTVPGTYTISVGAANLIGIGASRAVTLTLNAAVGTPQISNTGTTNTFALDHGGEVSADDATTATGNVGSAFSFQITATGNPTSYTASNLPAGLAINPSTGLITGIPSAAGTFQAQISASNGVGIGASTELVITISPPTSTPTVNSAPTATATAGTTYSYAMTATNSPTSYNASGLPTGLSLNSSTGGISGTPTIPGVYTVSLSANNATGTGPVLALTLTVNAAAGAPSITSVSTASGTVAATTSYQVTASNGPITAYAAINLPAGLTIDPVGGAITGAPTTAGTFTATVTATNAVGPSSPFPLEFTIAPAATSSSITSAATAGATAGAAFSYQITGSNAPTSFNVTGLPTGLTVNTSTGLISGSISTPGSYPITISINNATGTGATSTLTISVINPNAYARLTNLSARAYVNGGSSVLISGFEVAGSGTKELLLRGIGPGMNTYFQIADDLPDAELGLYDIDTILIASNHGWQNNPVFGPSTAAVTVNDTTETIMNTLGGFFVPAGSLDSAMDVTMPVGTYTFIVSGGGSNPGGVGLAEIYEADSGIPTARLVNISARANVGVDFNILIAGFTISGNTSETVLVRGVGPELNPLFGLSPILANPQLVVCDNPGLVIAQNIGWNNTPTAGTSQVPAIIQSATTAIFDLTGAFRLTVGSTSCALVVTLPPGNYTAQLSGINRTTGIGLIEVYEVP